MAYVRKEKETVEIDYPVGKVWEAISKAVHVLGWTVEETNPDNYHIRVKTRSNFMMYASLFDIDVKSMDEKTVRLSVTAETPVTTITSLVYFGRVKDRMNQFFEQLERSLTA
jgi:hypothetical protein